MADSERVLGVALGTHLLLDHFHRAEALTAAGKSQPFSNVSSALKRASSTHKSDVVWVALGWVSWESLGKLRRKGECDQLPWKDVCAEDHGRDNYVIKHIAGHEGWPIVALGVSSRKGNPREEAFRLMDWAASRQASELLRDYFLVVAHDDVRKRRSVVFELWSPDYKKLLASTSGVTSHPLPLHAVETNSSLENACGGPRNACPPYKLPADVLQLLREIHPPPSRR